MYKDRNLQKDEFNEESVYNYVLKMRNENAQKYIPRKLNTEYPSLDEIITKDENLKYIYDDDSFMLEIDGVLYNLESQILKKARDFLYITPLSKVKIYMKKHMISEVCDFPENNSLYIMILSGDMVTYGDENRTKQRHVATYQVYKGALDNQKYNTDEYYVYDISNLINEFKNEYLEDIPNNIFFTTSALRDYHYIKHFRI